MITRTYSVYVNRAGAYEVVPRGYSVSAAILGPFWALANDVFLRLLGWCLPAYLLVVLGMLIDDRFAIAGVIYAAGVSLLYFPLKAFAWRGEVLRAKGYELQWSTLAGSSKSAMAKYLEERSGAEA